LDRTRVIIVFALAWVSAAALSWFLYKKTSEPAGEKTAAVLALNRNLAAGTLIKDSDLTKVSVRVKEAPRGSLARKEDAVNRALLVDVTANEPLLDQKLARRSGVEGIAATIEEGKRAVAVKIDAASGVGELLDPGARVDVLYTKPGRAFEAIATTLLQNVQVLSVGRRTRPGERPDPKTKLTPLPVATLLVTPEEAQKLELAKNQGKISLVLRNPTDPKRLANTDPVTTQVLDPLAMERSQPRPPAKAARKRGPASAENGVEIEESPDLKKKKAEPPPPKAVVDVFRGAKHTQEVFR